MGFSLIKKIDQLIEMCYSDMSRKIQIITGRKPTYLTFLEKECFGRHCPYLLLRCLFRLPNCPNRELS